jgi:hypothetical protein
MHDKQNKKKEKKSTQGGARRRLATTAPELASGRHCVGDTLMRSCRSRQEGGAAHATIRGGRRDAPWRRNATTVEEEVAAAVDDVRRALGGSTRRYGVGETRCQCRPQGRGAAPNPPPVGRSPSWTGERSTEPWEGGRRRRRWGAGDTSPRCRPPHTGSGFHAPTAGEGKVGSRPPPVAEAAAPLARRCCRSAVQ